MKRTLFTKDMFRDWRVNKAVVVDRTTHEMLRFHDKEESLKENEQVVAHRDYLSHVIFTSEGEVTKLSPTRKVVKVIRHSPLTSEPRIKKSVHDKTPILKAVKQQAMTIKYVKPENCQCQKFTFVVNRKPVPKPDPAEHHPTCVHYVKPEEKPLPNFNSDKDFIAGPFPFKNPDTEGQIVK